MGSISTREFWTILHGMILGAIYLLAFSGGVSGFYMLKKEYETPQGTHAGLKQLKWGTSVMAVICWATVLSGTYFVYPWYRDKSPESPRSHLLANPEKSIWHTFGMEWKEHIAWISPILSTIVAFLVIYYGNELIIRHEIRRALLVLYSLAFFSAAIAGLYGAFLNKMAPIL